jgi:hypothetical protein
MGEDEIEKKEIRNMVHLHELNSQETKRHPQVFFGQLREGRGPYFVEGLNAWVTRAMRMRCSCCAIPG